MVEETIKAIRETEAAADVIVKEAGEKSQKILEDDLYLCSRIRTYT